MRSAIRPNLFIVGAPKSGTTALYSYLKSHSQIVMSKIKEPQFFASDICGDQRGVRTLLEYLNCFGQTVDKELVVIGEASTCYLGSKHAPTEIHEFSLGARVIVMLRNPIDVMYAEHSERVLGGAEHITDFKVALDAPEPRRWRSGPFKGDLVRNLSYRELTRFSEQLKRYFEVFGRENIHVIIYDDFAHNPALAYQAVLSFLRIAPHQHCDFGIVNANRRTRSRTVHDLLRYPPAPVKQVVRALLSQPMRHALGNRLLNLNIKQVTRPMLDKEFRKRLEIDYECELQQLSRLLDRDLLSAWAAPLV